MSNPFAVLSVNEDAPSRKNQKKQNAPKLTPAERAAKKEQREREKREKQPEITSSFVIVDNDDNSGFIEVDKKQAPRDAKDEKLSKKEFMSKKNRGELVNRNKGNRNQGNRNQGNRNQGNRNQGNRNQGNRNQGNRNQGNRKQGGKNQGNKNQGGKNQGNKNQKAVPSQWESKTKKEAGQKYVVKKERKSRNPVNEGKSQKKGGAGDFNWDDPLDANFEQKVEEAKDVVPEEIDVEPVEMESSEEWFHEEVDEMQFNTEEERDKYYEENIKPTVKRVGLRDYLNSQQTEDSKIKELTDQLSANVRSLDVVIPAEANLNKKNNFSVEDENDAFFFGKKDTSKKVNKKSNTSLKSNVDVQFRTKRHRGFNMPKERRQDGDRTEGSPKTRGKGGRNQGGNRGGNKNFGKRGFRNQGGNRKNPQLKKSAFPPLGGATNAPPVTVNTTWNQTQDE